MTSTAVRQTLNHVMPLFTLLISLYQVPFSYLPAQTQPKSPSQDRCHTFLQ